LPGCERLENERDRSTCLPGLFARKADHAIARAAASPRRRQKNCPLLQNGAHPGFLSRKKQSHVPVRCRVVQKIRWTSGSLTGAGRRGPVCQWDGGGAAPGTPSAWEPYAQGVARKGIGGDCQNE